jgi:hypothetical protein
MPSLTKALEKRIQELKTSIESQRAEMAAYERVLEIELAHAGQSQRADAGETADGAPGKTTPTEGKVPTDEASAGNAGIAPASGTETAPVFSGSKTDFVAAIVKARGISGATPKEVSDVFSARGIARSKNLIYNALSLLVKQKKLKKKDGRYFSVSADSREKPVAPRKWKISAAGLRNIREANKRRWAREIAGRKTRSRSAGKGSARS